MLQPADGRITKVVRCAGAAAKDTAYQLEGCRTDADSECKVTRAGEHIWIKYDCLDAWKISKMGENARFWK